jgi:hypothetical protein
MKTPLQELIDEMTYMLTEGERSIYALREKARKLLEKEKEVIMDAWMDDRFPLDKDWLKQCAEKYYNETFNTKER